MQEKTSKSISNEIIQITRDIRRLVQFNKTLGVQYYPKSKILFSFLNSKYLHAKNHQRIGPINKKISKAPPVSMVQIQEQLVEINKLITGCRLCSLTDKKTGIVTGQGSSQARLMIIGDWSQQNDKFSSSVLFGPEEDIMLRNMISAIGLDINSTYVTNCIKCCPPGKSIPDIECEQSCSIYLAKEIDAIKPEIILSMGELSAKILIDSKEPLFRLRGRFHRYSNYSGRKPLKIMPTFHPRFLLRYEEMKKASWLDLQAVQQGLSKK